MKLRFRGKTYCVVRAPGGTVIRISYMNAVLGRRPLDMTGKLARAIIESLKEQTI